MKKKKATTSLKGKKILKRRVSPYGDFFKSDITSLITQISTSLTKRKQFKMSPCNMVMSVMVKLLKAQCCWLFYCSDNLEQ